MRQVRWNSGIVLSCFLARPDILAGPAWAATPRNNPRCSLGALSHLARWGRAQRPGRHAEWGSAQVSAAAAHEFLDVGALRRYEAVDLAGLEPVEQRGLAGVVEPEDEDAGRLVVEAEAVHEPPEPLANERHVPRRAGGWLAAGWRRGQLLLRGGAGWQTSQAGRLAGCSI